MKRISGLCRHARGVTLVELLIVVAMVAILAAVALPSYSEHLRKSRRAEAQAFMMAVAARQQQFLVDTRAFADSLATVGMPVPSNVAGAYALRLEVQAGAPPRFTLSAVPTGKQVHDTCGSLTINEAGVKTPAGGCW